MTIYDLKINGLREPLGFELPYLSVSWKVRDTASKRAMKTRLSVVADEAFSQILARKEGADLRSTGETLDIPLRPGTRYFVRVELRGDAGDTAAAETRFETGKMSEPFAASWIGTQPEDAFHPVFLRRFTLPESVELPEGCRLAGMDEAAYERHPFSHGKNYSSWAAFRAEGSGAVIYYGGEIVASASSFLSLSGEVEMDVSTRESHRRKKLATACVARMLRDCMRRAITVHWDAQNEVSRHLAEKFGFEIETEYSVYWVL